MRKLFLLIILLAYPNFLNAANRFSLINFRPPMDGFIAVEGADIPLFKLGTMLNYEYRPFDLRNGNVKVRETVDHLFIEHFYGAAPILSWLSVGLDLPVAWNYYFNNPDVAAPTRERKTSLGDIAVAAKLLIIDSDSMDLAFLPFVYLPTGSDRNFIGNDGVVGGGKLIFQSPEFFNRLVLGLNIGAIERKRVVSQNIDFREQFYLGAGGRFNFSENFSAIVDIENTTAFRKFFASKTNTLINIRSGLQWENDNIKLLGGGGSSAFYGAGAPLFEVFAQIEWKPQIGSAAKAMPTAAPPPAVGKTAVIPFDWSSAKIKDSAAVIIGRVADILYYEKPNAVLKVMGYASQDGSVAYNKYLSTLRARRVKIYLEFHGIAPERIKVEGKGEIGGRQNRKVELIVEEN